MIYLGQKALPVEVCAVILTYLTPIALFSMTICSKKFFVLAHKNKRFEKKFIHSKKLISIESMYDKYCHVFASFAGRLQHKLEIFLEEDIRLIFRKKLLSAFIFDVLPFPIYDHLFNCDRGSYIKNRCNFCTICLVRDKKYLFFRQKIEV